MIVTVTGRWRSSREKEIIRLLLKRLEAGDSEGVERMLATRSVRSLRERGVLDIKDGKDT